MSNVSHLHIFTMSPQVEQLVHPRKSVILVLAAMPLVAIALSYLIDTWLWPAVLAWVKTPGETPVQRARFGIVIACILSIVILLGIAACLWFWLMALRIRRLGVFPPPGFPILATTAIIRGRATGRVARQLILSGLFCAAVCGYVVWSLFTIFPLAGALRAIGG